MDRDWREGPFLYKWPIPHPSPKNFIGGYSERFDLAFPYRGRWRAAPDEALAAYAGYLIPSSVAFGDSFRRAKPGAEEERQRGTPA